MYRFIFTENHGSRIIQLAEISFSTDGGVNPEPEDPDANFEAWKFDVNILDSAAISFFAYTCHAGLFPVYQELERKSASRMNKVAFRSVLIDAVFYIVVAVFGYLSTFSKTEEIVVNRDPLGGKEVDMWMMAARLMVWVSLVVGFPVNYNPFRNNLFHLIFGSAEFTNKGNFIMTTTTVVLTCFIAIVYPEITAVLSILGGLFSVCMCYLIPTYIYLKLSPEVKWSDPKSLVIIVGFGALCLIGWSSAAKTIV